MKLYVKKYLRKLPVIDQFCNMFLEYSKEYPNYDEDTYVNHKILLKNDSVRNFIDLMVPEDDILKLRLKEDWTPDTRETYITYLETLFNTVKGTYKVLDYLTEYDLFQTSIGENQTADTSTKINYTTQSITINIQSIPLNIDRNIFCDYLEAFLSALLYFESLTITINKISTLVIDDTTSSLNHGEAFYQYYEV